MTVALAVLACGVLALGAGLGWAALAVTRAATGLQQSLGRLGRSLAEATEAGHDRRPAETFARVDHR